MTRDVPSFVIAQLIEVYKMLLGFVLLCCLSSFLCCCSESKKREAKITFHSNAGNQFFLFSVLENDTNSLSFNNNHSNEKEISTFDLATLEKLLISNSYCLDRAGTPYFRTMSKQLTSYNKTFYHFISQVHKLKEQNILSYYGKCLETK